MIYFLCLFISIFCFWCLYRVSHNDKWANSTTFLETQKQTFAAVFQNSYSEKFAISIDQLLKYEEGDLIGRWAGRLGELANLGKISPSLRNSYENIMCSFEKWASPPLWNLTWFCRDPTYHLCAMKIFHINTCKWASPARRDSCFL